MNNFLGLSTGTTTLNPSPMKDALTMGAQAANIYTGIQTGGASTALTAANNATTNNQNSQASYYQWLQQSGQQQSNSGNTAY